MSSKRSKNRKIKGAFGNKNYAAAIIAVLLVLLYYVGTYFYNTAGEYDVEVLAFPVSRGDSIAVKLKNNHNILIDCGSSDLNSVGEEIVAPQMMLHGIHSLYAIIVTHDDSDHTNGLKTIIDTFKPQYIIIADENIENKTLSFMNRSPKYKDIKFRYVRAGDKLKIDDETLFTFLYPLRNAQKSLSKNNSSIVVRLDYKKSSALFTGDLEFVGENLLLKSRYKGLLDVDLLKVAHHGSRGSSSEKFLKAVSPDIGIISCPKNDRNGYHPHEELLKRLAAERISVLRTGEIGVVKVKSNGYNWVY